MSRQKTDFVAKARAAWGSSLPDWVEALAAKATQTSQAAAAARIGYSASALSYIFANKYGGDVARIAAKVRGALMNETVMCPIVGEIGRDRCLDEQKMPFSASSSIRSKLFRACRNGCPHSRIEKKGDAA